MVSCNERDLKVELQEKGFRQPPSDVAAAARAGIKRYTARGLAKEIGVSWGSLSAVALEEPVRAKTLAAVTAGLRTCGLLAVAELGGA